MTVDLRSCSLPASLRCGPEAMRRIAVVGSGIAACRSRMRWRRRRGSRCSRPATHFGGHTHTVDVHAGRRAPRRRHRLPGLQRAHLPAPDAPVRASSAWRPRASDMSFSVQVPQHGPRVERLRPEHRVRAAPQPAAPALPGACWRDILRFNRLATGIAERGDEAATGRADRRLPRRATASARDFRDWYLLPMIGCIWSCPTDQMLRFPVGHDDPLLPQPRPDPGARTGRSGTRCAAARATYVQKMLARIPDARLNTPVRARAPRAAGSRRRASPPTPAANTSTRWCWPATATRRWRCWPTPSDDERARARRHPLPAATAPCCTPTPSVLPRRRRAWAAWNYERAADARARAGRRVPALPDQPAAAAALAHAGGGVAEPGARAARRHGASASSTTRTRCSTLPPSPRSAGCRSCRAARTPGSAAPGRATASTRTA